MRTRTRSLLLIFTVLLVGGALAAAAAALGLDARNRLQQAEQALQAGVAAVRSGQPEAAAEHFGDAGRHTQVARDRLYSPPLRLASFVPVVGDGVDAAVGVTETALLVARAGEQLTLELVDVPGGLEALARDPGDALVALQRLAQPLEEARTTLVLARATARSTPADTAFDTIDRARAQLAAELDEVLPTVDTLSAVAHALPEFLGVEGPRRYFLAAQNPAELRGSGGFIGAYAILEVERGAVRVSPFRPTQELDRDLLDETTAPDDTFLETYEEFVSGPGTWLNVNFTPDFPTAAIAIERFYDAAVGEQVDGVVAVDVGMLELMLEVTGPVFAPEVGTLRAEGVSEYVTRTAYEDLGVGAQNAQRKEILGDAAQAVFDAFLTRDGISAAQRVDVLARAVAGGHLLLHSADPRIQSELEDAGLAGTVVEPEPLALQVLGLNWGENKVDTWVSRDVRWEVVLGTDGSARAAIEVTLTNDAPSQGYIPYVIGPNRQDGLLGAGDSLTQLVVLCGACLHVDTVWEQETQRGLDVGSELGHNVLRHLMLVESGETQASTHIVDVPAAWQRAGSSRGRLELSWHGQTTLQPTDLEIDLTPPPGWEFVNEDPAFSREGNRLVWRGEAPYTLDLTLRLRQTG